MCKGKGAAQVSLSLCSGCTSEWGLRLSFTVDVQLLSTSPPPPPVAVGVKRASHIHRQRKERENETNVEGKKAGAAGGGAKCVTEPRDERREGEGTRRKNLLYFPRYLLFLVVWKWNNPTRFIRKFNQSNYKQARERERERKKSGIDMREREKMCVCFICTKSKFKPTLKCLLLALSVQMYDVKQEDRAAKLVSDSRTSIVSCMFPSIYSCCFVSCEKAHKKGGREEMDWESVTPNDALISFILTHSVSARHKPTPSSICLINQISKSGHLTGLSFPFTLPAIICLLSLPNREKGRQKGCHRSLYKRQSCGEPADWKHIYEGSCHTENTPSFADDIQWTAT